MQDLEERVRELEAAVRWCVVAMIRGCTTRENRPKIVEKVINGKSHPVEVVRQPTLETRITTLEAAIQTTQDRQKDKKRRYAFDWYVKERCALIARTMYRMNNETAQLAVTSKAVGEKALIVASIGLVVGVTGSIFSLLTFCSPKTPR